MKLNLNIWWHRIIFVFVVALIFSVTMFIIKEKPFSGETPFHGHDEETGPHLHDEAGSPIPDEEHIHPEGTPEHEDE